jgi:uncharacterized protein (TIGR00369 family)
MAEAVTAEKVQTWLGGSPFMRFLGLTVESLDAASGSVAIKMPMRAELERAAGSGQFHGGPVAALIDTVGDFAVAVIVGGGVPTINFRVDYLRPSSGAYLIGKATVRRAGRTVGVVDVDVVDEQSRLTAVGRGCYGMQTG